jgi:hypothetical protein
VGLALRHLDLVDIVIRRSPSLAARSLLTLAGPIDGLAMRVARHLGVELREARQALDCLTLTPAAAISYGAWPAPPPPLVQVARDKVAWSVAGTLAAPLEFLLTQLRARYRPEWDRAVNSREERFRAEIYRLFSTPAPDRFVTAGRPVRIRDAGRVRTDVDALVYDRQTGDLALFQLKWQDALGFSSTRLASGRRNFVSETAEWVSRVGEWLRARTLQEAARTLGLSGADAKRVAGVRLFVLGRNFAHFSGAEPEETSIAWATWPQFLNRVAQLLPDKAWANAPLRLLHDRLRADSPHRRSIAVVRPAQLRIGSVLVRIEPLCEQAPD